MKEGQEVVEDVAVLDQPVRSRPRDVQVLLLVGVKAVAEKRERPQHERGRGGRGEEKAFGFGQAVERQASACRRGAP